MIKHIAKCLGVSWLAAASLGLLYGACIVRSASIVTLWRTGVVQVSFILSTAMAILLITPLAVWALPRGYKPKWIVPLWLLLAVFCMIVTLHSAVFGLYGTLSLAIVGLFGIGYLAQKRKGVTH